MTDYKVFPLDALDHVSNVYDIECASDADALAEAARMLSPCQRAEVWQRGRLVARVESLEPPKQPAAA